MPNQLSEDKEIIGYAERKDVKAEIKKWCAEESKRLGRKVTTTDFYQMLVRKELNKRRKAKGMCPMETAPMSGLKAA
jgi:hypothetical protein